MSLLLNEIISTTYPEVYQHLLATTGMEVDQIMLLIFQSQIISIFVKELFDVAPKIASHIFDCFLLEGEIVICTLFIKFIEHSQEEIL